LWGYGRATSDIDFLAHRDDMDKVDAVMKSLDYECRYKSDNVSQYLSPLKIFGEVDFIHAYRETSLAMLRNAEEKTIINGDLKIRVLKPESLTRGALMNTFADGEDILDNTITEDMKVMEHRRHNPFMKNGKADVDAYIRFVCSFNEFINHEPKLFSRIIDRDMIL